MAVRRCPSCKNLVDVETGECPVCGKSYARAIAGRITRWAIILSVLAVVAHHFVR
jgi:RNA polymerase subunit RPABC4/transcription elongation factor Spt4